MNQLIQLKQDRAAALDSAVAVTTIALNEKRALTETEETTVNDAMAKAENLKRSIDLMEKVQFANTDSVAERAAAQPTRQPVEVRDLSAEKPWGSFGEFLSAVRQAEAPGRMGIDSRLTRAVSGMNETVSADGGFFVQPDFSSELLKKSYETGELIKRVRKVPISGDSNSIKINAVDESSRVNGSRFGGVQAYWAGEGDTLTGSKPKFRQIELNLKKLTGLCYATEELLKDAAALESIIRDAFTDEFAFKLDDGIFRGSGAGMPLGFLDAPGTVVVSKESGPQTADTIVFENIKKMYSRMWARSRGNAVWLINQEAEQQLMGMKFDAGATSPVPVYLPANSVAGTPYATLFGRPVIAIEHASALGDKGDISFVDLNQYIVADKGGINSAVSMHVRFLNDESVFRFILRADGQPIWNLPLTPYKGAATLSPFVTLEAR